MNNKETSSKWKFCPECRSTEIVNENLVGEGYRECEKCGQEWWTDVDYAEVIELSIKDYKEVIESNKALVRELDILINGDNAAKQASLCDIVAQLSKEKRFTTPPAASSNEGERDFLWWINSELEHLDHLRGMDNTAKQNEYYRAKIEMLKQVLNKFQALPTPTPDAGEDKWISVNDELPAKGTWVVAAILDLNSYMVRTVYFQKNGTWFDYKERITKWQPLPKAPAVNN